MAQAGILEAKSGHIRLRQPEELPEDWNSNLDTRLTAWKMVHYLVRVLESSSKSAAAELTVVLGVRTELACELCCRFYTPCELKK